MRSRRSAIAWAAFLTLLLVLPASCGLFRSRTVDAAKETVKALPDLLELLKALVAALSTILVQKLGAALDAIQALVPKVAHLADTIDGTAHAAGYATWLGAAAIALLIVYASVHRLTEGRRHDRHSRASG